MAVLLTPVVAKKLMDPPNHHRFVFEVPAILAASSSPRYELPVWTAAGEIKQLRICWTNQDSLLSFFIGTKDDNFRNTLDEIIKSERLTSNCNPGGLPVIYDNTDTVLNPVKGQTGIDNLYLEIDNLAITGTSGVVSIELIIQSSGSG